MLKNYLTIALRTMRRHKGYTFINVAGLAVGLAVCLLILLYVRDEQSYERFREKASRIFRVVEKTQASTVAALAPVLAEELPAVEHVVRKALGASAGSIVLLLAKDFTRLVLLAFVVAVPLGYVTMHGWLQHFAYHINVGPLPFLIAGSTVLLITWLTVSYQSIKAAHTNPVETLRQ